MKPQKLILLALLKNILLEGKKTITVLDMKQLLQSMNQSMKESMFSGSFETNWQEVDSLLERNFTKQGMQFLPSNEVLENVAKVRDFLNGFELFAFKETVKNKLDNAQSVKSINRRILEQIKPKSLLEELGYWRKISINLTAKDYQHLFGGKTVSSQKYDICKDI